MSTAAKSFVHVKDSRSTRNPTSNTRSVEVSLIINEEVTFNPFA